MRSEDLSLLRCPECRGPLSLAGGELGSSCGRRYAVRGGIPRLLTLAGQPARALRTRGGFDAQWRYSAEAFSDEAVYENEARFRDIFGGEVPPLEGKLFLDAGCGMGRYSGVARARGARVVSLDFTEAGVSQTSRRWGTFVVQGDILKLPLADAAFDVVFSMGVIHHTSNMRLAFSRLVRALKPGGWMVLGVYRTFPGVDTVRALRKFTTLLPPEILFLLCFAAVPLSFVPRLGGYCYPWLRREDPWKKKVIETYDHYHPPYQEYTDPEEVRRWFQEEGCEWRRIPFGSYIGRKLPQKAPTP